MKVTKQYVNEEVDDLLENSIRKDNRRLIEKCLSDNVEESQVAMAVYDRIDARERDLVYKEAQDEMASILQNAEDGTKNIVKTEGENPIVVEARFWTLRKDLWERYSIYERILNEGL